MNIWQRSSSPRSSGRNRIYVFLLLGLALAGLAVLSLVFGSTHISISEALGALVDGDRENTDFRILAYIRLPRTVAALFSGAALAVSGVLIQAVLQNPMAAPNIIGVNSGAGLAATLTVAVFPSALPFLPLSAFLGALLACLLIYAIAMRTSAGRLTVTLVGIAVGSVLNACINTVKVAFPDSIYDADLFMIGGFAGVTFKKILPACILIAVALVTARLLAADTDVLTLGADTAKSLGMNVSLFRFVLLVLASVLAGAAVSFSGLLGFVGLLVPHIVRRFVGGRHCVLIPCSALLGGCLVIACDLVSRVILAPYELPVGIILSLLGGVFFIGLVLFGRRGEDI